MTARHRADLPVDMGWPIASPPPVVDGRGAVPFTPPVPYRNHVALQADRASGRPIALQPRGRATLETEYRGLGIDPALIDIIESGARREADTRPVARNADELTAIDDSGRFTHRYSELPLSDPRADWLTRDGREVNGDDPEAWDYVGE